MDGRKDGVPVVQLDRRLSPHVVGLLVFGNLIQIVENAFLEDEEVMVRLAFLLPCMRSPACPEQLGNLETTSKDSLPSSYVTLKHLAP